MRWLIFLIIFAFQGVSFAETPSWSFENSALKKSGVETETWTFPSPILDVRHANDGTEVQLGVGLFGDPGPWVKVGAPHVGRGAWESAVYPLESETTYRWFDDYKLVGRYALKGDPRIDETVERALSRLEAEGLKAEQLEGILVSGFVRELAKAIRIAHENDDGAEVDRLADILWKLAPNGMGHKADYQRLSNWLEEKGEHELATKWATRADKHANVASYNGLKIDVSLMLWIAILWGIVLSGFAFGASGRPYKKSYGVVLILLSIAALGVRAQFEKSAIEGSKRQSIPAEVLAGALGSTEGLKWLEELEPSAERDALAAKAEAELDAVMEGESELPPAVSPAELEALVQSYSNYRIHPQSYLPGVGLLLHLLLFLFGRFLYGRGLGKWLRYFPGATAGIAAPILVTLYAAAFYWSLRGSTFQSMFMDRSPVFEHAKPSILVPTIILFTLAIGVHVASIATTRLKTQEAEPT